MLPAALSDNRTSSTLWPGLTAGMECGSDERIVVREASGIVTTLTALRLMTSG
jgi:hypothetical protein